jgi:serine O-acetyltransferase
MNDLPEADGDRLARADHWNLDDVIAGLRDGRATGAEARPGDWTDVRLPSRRAIERIVDGLVSALFPRHFGPPHLTEEGIDYYVGNTLDVTLRLLVDQVRRERRWTVAEGPPRDPDDAPAVDIVRAFAAQLPGIRLTIESDVVAAYRGDPAAKSIDEVLVCYPGIAATTRYRLAHALHRLGTPLVARIIAELAHAMTGVDIHPAAEIGRSFFIDHGTGVVIGETTRVGDGVRIYQAVTLGAKSFPARQDGALVKGAARHPIVEDDVVIYAGATILGRVTIGRGSVVGGNVWLTRSVPPGSSITQATARTDAFDAGGGI